MRKAEALDEGRHDSSMSDVGVKLRSSTDSTSALLRANLGILGASVMGTSGARNPTLTAQALAWRTGEHLAKAWKTIAT